MSRKPFLQTKALVTAIFLVVGLPVGARLAWLWLGPPVINLAENPGQEFVRLEHDLEQDSLTVIRLFAHLSRLGIIRNPLVRSVAIFFCSPNLPKYSECFLDLARHHLDNHELAKQSLLKAIQLDNGWNGHQAVGLFVARYSDDISAEQVSLTLNMYDRSFARQQLINMNKETHSPRVHVAVLATLGNLYKEDGDQAEAKRYFELATTELENVDRSEMTLVRQQLKSELYEINRLAINTDAPEIVGTIQDGTVMRLSDFKKKVICLDFWGDW